jgi:hypothetical protein
MNSFQDLFDRQKRHFATGVARSRGWRIEQFDRMSQLVAENESTLQQAIGQDFKTASQEQIFETGACLGEVAYQQSQLDRGACGRSESDAGPPRTRRPEPRAGRRNRQHQGCGQENRLRRDGLGRAMVHVSGLRLCARVHCGGVRRRGENRADRALRRRPEIQFGLFAHHQHARGHPPRWPDRPGEGGHRRPIRSRGPLPRSDDRLSGHLGRSHHGGR